LSSKYLIRQEACINVLHVQGQQDSTTPEHELNVEARLNIRAEKLATAAMKAQQKPKYHELPYNRVNVWIDTASFTSKVKMALRTGYLSTPILEHYQHPFGWTAAKISQIWWDSHGSVIQSLPNADRVRIQKFFHNNWQYIRRQSKFIDHVDDICPQCLESGGQKITFLNVSLLTELYSVRTWVMN
jgi:hypothetical protein